MRRIECPDLVAAVLDRSECASECEHLDESPRLVITLRGEAIDSGPGYEVARAPHSAMFRPAGTVHRLRASRDSSVVTIGIRRDRLAALEQTIGTFSRPVYAPPQTLGTWPAELARDLERPDEELPLRVESAVLAIVARMAAQFRRSQENRRPAWLDDAVAEVARLHTTREEVARTVGVTPRALAEALLAHEGRSFEELLRAARLERARELLASTCRGIAEIAQATGFYDHAHLVRAFRGAYGTTPSNFRRTVSKPR